MILTFAILSTVSLHTVQDDLNAPLKRLGSLGLQLSPLTSAELSDVSATSGVKISGVITALTGDKAGLKVGDILESINGTTVGSPAEVIKFVKGKRAGEPIEFKVIREKKKLDLKSFLVEKPKQKPDGFNVDYDQVVSNGKRIRIIATYPEGKGPFPTVFMIAGIGGFSCDGEYKTIPYGKILEPLAKNGYAVIRMEKPGQGDSDGPSDYTDLLFDDELDAYLQSVKHVKNKPYVDKTRFAIFGHSMGGAFAPLVAAKEPVKAVISCATMSKTWIEYNLENNRRQSALAGADPAALDQEMVQMSKVLHYIFNDDLSPNEIIAKYPSMEAAVKDFTPDLKTMSGVNIKFFQQLNHKNLPEAWKNSNCKVLSLWGETDFISTQWDQENIAAIVNQYRPGTAEYKLLPQSDHGFMTTTSFLDSRQKWGQPGGVHNPIVNKVITEWLAANL